jgi:hypothetical protein
VIIKYKIFEADRFGEKIPSPKYDMGEKVYYHGMHTNIHGFYIISGRMYYQPIWRYDLKSEIENILVLHHVWETSLSSTEEEGIMKDREYKERQLKRREIDPYDEEMWESLDIDPYGEEDWNELGAYEEIVKYIKELQPENIECACKKVNWHDSDAEFYYTRTGDMFYIEATKVLDMRTDPFTYYYSIFKSNPLTRIEMSQEEAYELWKYMKDLFEKKPLVLQKIRESITDMDPYGEEDWNYKETYVKLWVDIDGDKVTLRYKELDELPSTDEIIGTFNRCIYIKKAYDLFQTQPATFHLLKILHEEVKRVMYGNKKKVLGITKNSYDEKLFSNLLKLNDQVKTLLGETAEDWFDAVRNIAVVE